MEDRIIFEVARMENGFSLVVTRPGEHTYPNKKGYVFDLGEEAYVKEETCKLFDRFFSMKEEGLTKTTEEAKKKEELELKERVKALEKETESLGTKYLELKGEIVGIKQRKLKIVVDK